MVGKIKLKANRSLFWYNTKNELHRRGGPAIISYSGYKEWIVKNQWTHYQNIDDPSRLETNFFKRLDKTEQEYYS